jgi:hypothetical protein
LPRRQDLETAWRDALQLGKKVFKREWGERIIGLHRNDDRPTASPAREIREVYPIAEPGADIVLTRK